jgi:hypothetical protein
MDKEVEHVDAKDQGVNNDSESVEDIIEEPESTSMTEDEDEDETTTENENAKDETAELLLQTGGAAAIVAQNNAAKDLNMPDSLANAKDDDYSTDDHVHVPEQVSMDGLGDGDDDETTAAAEIDAKDEQRKNEIDEDEQSKTDIDETLLHLSPEPTIVVEAANIIEQEVIQSTMDGEQVVIPESVEHLEVTSDTDSETTTTAEALIEEAPVPPQSADSRTPKLNNNHVLNMKTPDDFLNGLDGLEKFLEHVDAPAELDVAAGSSMQDVLIQKSTQIITKHVVGGWNVVRRKAARVSLATRAKLNRVFESHQALLVVRDKSVAQSRTLIQFSKETLRKIKNAVESNQILSKAKDGLKRIQRIFDGDDDDDYDDDGSAGFDMEEDTELQEMMQKLKQQEPRANLKEARFLEPLGTGSTSGGGKGRIIDDDMLAKIRAGHVPKEQ